jgi:hypothetical protein
MQDRLEWTKQAAAARGPPAGSVVDNATMPLAGEPDDVPEQAAVTVGKKLKRSKKIDQRGVRNHKQLKKPAVRGGQLPSQQQLPAAGAAAVLQQQHALPLLQPFGTHQQPLGTQQQPLWTQQQLFGSQHHPLGSFQQLLGQQPLQLQQQTLELLQQPCESQQQQYGGQQQPFGAQQQAFLPLLNSFGVLQQPVVSLRPQQPVASLLQQALAPPQPPLGQQQPPLGQQHLPLGSMGPQQPPLGSMGPLQPPLGPRLHRQLGLLQPPPAPLPQQLGPQQPPLGSMGPPQLPLGPLPQQLGLQQPPLGPLQQSQLQQQPFQQPPQQLRQPWQWQGAEQPHEPHMAQPQLDLEDLPPLEDIVTMPSEQQQQISVQLGHPIESQMHLLPHYQMELPTGDTASAGFYSSLLTDDNVPRPTG